MNETEEQIYIEGEQKAYKRIIQKCQSELRCLGAELKTKEEFSEERVEAISVLRSLCRYFGDNEWDDTLHLADVIDKHLGKYLHQNNE